MAQRAESRMDLRDAPIPANWILAGEPKASNHVVATASDNAAITIVWECTPGLFRWNYDIDETICFISGSVVISAPGLGERRYGPGDILQFHKGETAIWRIEETIRKVAFCRTPLPGPLAFARKIWRAGAKRLRRGRRSAQPTFSAAAG